MRIPFAYSVKRLVQTGTEEDAVATASADERDRAQRQGVRGLDALKTALANRYRKYPGRDDARCRGSMLMPHVTPSFRLEKSGAIFTIGSCFARNIEEPLVAAGYRVPTAEFDGSMYEDIGRKNRILNQYSPATMAQVVAEALKEEDAVDLEAALIPAKTEGHVHDPLYSIGVHTLPRAAAIERRRKIRALYRNGLAEARYVLITLGLVETWYDTEAGLYLNQAPPNHVLRADDVGRYRFVRLSAGTCRRMLRQLLVDLDRAGEKKKVVLTVSPVPIMATFADMDPVTANQYSKAVLRVAAEAIVSATADVDYFPSYEAVTSMGLSAFGEDNLHVRPKIVEEVTRHMLELYGEGDVPLAGAA
ncbi:GSCFA domain-containing protein [Acuticoccus mangrovi]|uniref:GSCFA domain-containing protein n=1 Tax=Acuticoccus mangrovi TaxID=2796142 RepID=A0A934MJG0_9HYPH|nr:GSCFA domain-containing protein [Acuticoccus mangrovi]